jgi:hypothetical protein
MRICIVIVVAAGACDGGGEGARNAPCVAQNDCAEGWSCVATAGAQYCLEDCAAPGDCAAPSGCTLSNMTSGETWCSLPCDPVTADGCPAAASCAVSSPTEGGHIVGCLVPGATGEGQVCMRNADCASGHTCIAEVTATVCRRSCRITAPASTCPLAAAICRPYDVPFMIDGVEYGVCQP